MGGPRCEKITKNSASTDGGPRSRVCARKTLCSAPHRHDQNFFGAHVWRGQIFSSNQAILSTFRGFSFYPRKSKNCGHCVCLASLKIVITMFTCYIPQSSGMCLHLAWNNMSSFLVGPEQYFSLLQAANEEACFQVISQSETRRPFLGVGGVPGFVF